MKKRLIDTGPIVSYLDRRDASHRIVAESLRSFKGQLVTTAAVVAEVMYFLSEFPNGPNAFAQFLFDAEVYVVDMCQPEQVLVAADLMARYADTPMDFADATLVLLAESLNISEIFTLDRRGFSIYRLAKGKSVRLF